MARLRYTSLIMGTLAALLLVLAGGTQAATVSGTVLLNDQNNHSLVTVRFLGLEGNPSYWTSTDNDGSYSLTVNPGAFEIRYEKPGWTRFVEPRRIIQTDAVLPVRTLAPRPLSPLVGTVQGTLEAGDYTLTEDVIVPQGQNLTLEPGVVIYGEFNATLTLDDASLHAVGTVEQPIVFTSVYPSQQWYGITLDVDNTLPDSVHLVHVDISDSRNSGLKIEHSGGDSSHVIIRHSRFHHNEGITPGSGDGIWAYGATTLHISDSRFDNNASQGLYLSWSSTTILDNCMIEYNHGNGISVALPSTQIDVRRTLFRGNQSNNGAAIYIANDGTPDVQMIRDCRFEENVAVEEGGAIRTEVEAVIERCVFSGNTAALGGAVMVAANDFTTELINCTFVNNQSASGGQAVHGGDAEIANSLFVGHNSPTVSLNNGAPVVYCDLFDNDEPLFAGNMPPELGEIVDENYNGDLCDGYSNIFLDPLLSHPAGGDYNLTFDSPCIDAGSPITPIDPDGTIADIGAYPFDQDGPVVTLQLTVVGESSVPPSGGNLSYDAVLSSQLNFAVPAVAWTTVILPNGQPFGPLDDPTPLFVAPGVTHYNGLMLDVPSFAPPGVYLHRVHLGPSMGNTVVMGAFSFTKSALTPPGHDPGPEVTAWKGFEGRTVRGVWVR